MIFTITEQKLVVNLPSASGIIKYNEYYYVIGDDSPFLFKLNRQFEVIERYPINSHAENFKTGRIPKSKKPDFEGLEMISEGVFMVIGSGSKSPQRDTLILINANDGFSTERYQLTDFYLALQNMEIMKGSELNLEAIAYSNNILYMFNRKKNIVFTVKYDELLAYLSDVKPLPAIESKTFNLPQINGIEAGFSGATFYKNANVMLLTASVENTDNAYDDGEVLGSFVGIVPLPFNDNPIHWQPIKSDGHPLKIESVAVEKMINDNELEVVLAADNDDGQSTFLRGRLSW